MGCCPSRDGPRGGRGSDLTYRIQKVQQCLLFYVSVCLCVFVFVFGCLCVVEVVVGASVCVVLLVVVCL